MREYQSGEPEDGAATIALPEITFTLDGEKFTCVGHMTGDALLDWSEMADAAAQDLSATSPEGAAFIARFLRAAFGAEEYRRFRAHLRAHRTRPEVVLKVVSGIQEEMAGVVETATARPTAAPSPSSAGGAAPDERTARIMSLSTGEVKFVDPPPPKTGKTRKRTGTTG
jgi:hypothetical protein